MPKIVRNLIFLWLVVCSATYVSARPYGDWRQANFGPSWTNPAVAGDTADPDADGWVNAVEYAFGQDPNAPSTPLWKSERPAGTQFLYFERMDASDLYLYIERSSTLEPGSWELIATSVTGQPFDMVHPDYGLSENDLGGGRYMVIVKEASSVTKRFFRVRSEPASLMTMSAAPDPVTLGIGQTQAFTATGTYSDGFMENMTTMATWSSGNPLVAAVSNAIGSQGVATAISLGSSVIQASYGTQSDSCTLSVGPAIVTSIAVTPSNPALAVGLTQQFTATATFSDASTQNLTSTVTWSSSNTTVGAISNAPGANGMATAAAPGYTTITANLGVISDNTTLTVIPPTLVSITVTPINPSITTGTTQQFNATGTFSDGSTQNLTTQVTWTTDSPGIATVSNAPGSHGLASAVAVGSTTIHAISGSVTGNTQINVTAPLPPSVVSVTPTDAATNVTPFTTVSITFSVPMNPATLTAQTTAGPAAASIQVSRDGFTTCHAFTGPPVMSAGNTVATLTLSPALSYGTTWQARVTTAVQSATSLPLSVTFTQATGFTTAIGDRCPPGLVISQVYGGGGNTGSIWTNDFIELHNPRSQAVSTAGHAVQYAGPSDTGTWTTLSLPSVNIPAGGYFLVQLAAGSGGTTPLPAPDAFGAIAMSATSGKVALTNSTTALSGALPASAAILDLVGYGTANGYEGAAPVVALTNTTSAQRMLDGNADNNINNVDFTTGTPTPRNMASPPSIGNCTNNESGRSDELDYAAIQFPLSITSQTGTTTPVIYAQIYEAGLTESVGPASGMQCQIGYGPVTANPENQAGWTWFTANYNIQAGNNDEYAASFTAPFAGDYRYSARFSRDGVNWTYADVNGAGSNAGLIFDTYSLPVLTVTP